MRNYTIILLSAILILLITEKGYFLFWTGLISPHAKFCIAVIFRRKCHKKEKCHILLTHTQAFKQKHHEKYHKVHAQNINAIFTISTGKKSLSQPSPETAAEL